MNDPKSKISIDADELRQAASGQWLHILEVLTPQIAEALNNPGKKHIRCPLHNGNNDFRVFKDVDETGGGICSCGSWPNGFSLIMALNGCDFRTMLEQVASVIGYKGSQKQYHSDYKKPNPIVYKPKLSKDGQIKYSTLYRNIWSHSYEINDSRSSILRLYLENRGLNAEFDPSWPIRFNPSVAYYNEEGFVDNFPAMICLVTNHKNVAVSLHITYLDENGNKADVPNQKKLMPSLTGSLLGCSIKLGAAKDHVIGVTEGVETALAIIQARGYVVWPTLNTSVLKSFFPPNNVESVISWSDKDTSLAGYEASLLLKEKLSELGYGFLILEPPIDIPLSQKGVDWLDVFNRLGSSAVPELNF